jgi:GntR family transcriptional regulator, phosphonate transport system regulatory protein
VRKKKKDQVRDWLRGKIARGTYAHGDRLPPVKTLAEQFDVSWLTVTQAIKEMELTGELRVQNGVGTFITSPRIVYDLNAMNSLTGAAALNKVLLRREIARIETIAAPVPVARHLQVSAGRKMFRIKAVIYADEAPMTLSTYWFVKSLVPDLDKSFSGQNSITEALRHCGIEQFERQWTTIGARRIDAEQAAALRLPVGAPSLVDENVDALPDGRPLKYSVSVNHPERMVIRIDNRTEAVRKQPIQPSQGTKS